MVLVELVELTKLGLAVAVWCYVYFFLRNTEDHIERRPWEYLYVACMTLFLFELISFLQIFRARAYGAEFFGNIKGILELSFLGLMLIAFLNQHKLLIKEKLIIISQARPKDVVDAAFRERELRIEREEENKEVKEEKKEQEIFNRDWSELPTSTPEASHDSEYIVLESKARDIIKQCEALLATQSTTDPVKVALFRDELADLQTALDDPYCTTQRLQRKINNILRKD